MDTGVGIEIKQLGYIVWFFVRVAYKNISKLSSTYLYNLNMNIVIMASTNYFRNKFKNNKVFIFLIPTNELRYRLYYF